MNILELCLSPDLGGLELYMQRCCRELAPRHTLHPWVVAGGRLDTRLREEGFTPQTLAKRSGPLPWLSARRLAAYIDQHAIDVLHMHWTKDLPLAALARRLSRRKPLLVSTRQMQITRPKRDPYHDWLYAQVGVHLAITDNLAGNLRRFLNPAYADRVERLYYGVAPPRHFLSVEERAAKRAELGFDDDTFAVCLVGRVKHYKGQHLLVEALGRMLTRGERVAGLIVGHAMDQTYLDNLKRRVQENGWQAAILFRDFIEQPQQIMQACDCVVLTTVEETFGLVLPEAMRAGVAVIGSDRGGVPEIIEHGVSGLLFRSTEVDDLEAQLETLRQDPTLRARLAKAGQQRADTLFDDALHFPALEALLVRRLQATTTAH